MYKLSCLRVIILGLLMLTVSPCLLDASDGDVVTADGTARESSKNIVKFAYDLNFEMNFDNREYDMTTLSPSMTIFGARLTPSAGISVRQSDKISHKVMAGIDVISDALLSPRSRYLTERMSRRSQNVRTTGIFSMRFLSTISSKAGSGGRI